MDKYNEKNTESKAIDVEIVNESPTRSSARLDEEKVRTFFHPASGLAILLLDWLAFGTDVPTAFVLTPLVSLVTFGLTYAAVYYIQRHESGDNTTRANWKAVLGAVAAGVPFPITGTILGAGILLLSGLPLSGKGFLYGLLKSRK
jgi:hypothetical protein